MKNSFIKAQLTAMNHFQVLVFTTTPRTGDIVFTLFKGNETPKKIFPSKSSSASAVTIYEFDLSEDFDFSLAYSIGVSGFPNQRIDVSEAINFKEFDYMFNYEGNDLGATYHKEYTDFALWAPLANLVLLRFSDGETCLMKRSERGVFRLRVNGDLLNKKYVYLIDNSGVISYATDPYSYGVSENSTYSAVVDLEAIKAMGKVPLTSKLENYVDAIIYETNIRDLTEQKGDVTDIVNRGKYLGFIEEGRKTKGGHPAGLDYLKFLSINVVQLNPVIDFGTADDFNLDKKYNWGYDPINMFSLEGCYSLHPEIPMERLVEFKTLVNALHKNDIRLVMDVVYNHTYEYMSSCYQKIVPDYFFRRRRDGNLANASGCGNDFASERYMARKMIVDSLKYFVEVFDIDGYRFDLMGLIDIDTINKGVDECKNLKNDLMFYGEGWNMGDLPYEDRACSDHHDRIHNMGFFNDTFRDVVKGSTFDGNAKGYIGGDTNYAFGLKYVFYGSILNVNYDARFSDANQSINFIECHDNNTLFDKLRMSNSDEDDEMLLKRVRLANGLLLLSFGVPFIHMGQEIGLSKKGNGNTYNLLKLNQMDWSLVDERFEMVNFVRSLIRLRKSAKLYSLHSRNDINTGIVEFIEQDNCLILRCVNKELLAGFSEVMFLINTTDEIVNIDLEGEYDLIFSSPGKLKNPIKVTQYLLAPCVVAMVTRK